MWLRMCEPSLCTERRLVWQAEAVKIRGASVCFSLAFGLECAHVIEVLVIFVMGWESWSLTESSMRTLNKGSVGEDSAQWTLSLANYQAWLSTGNVFIKYSAAVTGRQTHTFTLPAAECLLCLRSIPAGCYWSRNWTSLILFLTRSGKMTHWRWGPGRSCVVWPRPQPRRAVDLLSPWPWTAPCHPRQWTRWSPSGWPCKRWSGSEGSEWTWVPGLRMSLEGRRGRSERLV